VLILKRTGMRTALVTTLALAGLAVSVQSASAAHYIGLHLAALNGHAQPTIWFVDRTDASWPVTAAADEWNRSSRLTVGRRAECPHPGDYCPPVHQVNNSNFYGRTFRPLNADLTHISRFNFYIELSNSTPSTRRRSVACHEEGHALGLEHRQPADSCLRADNVFPNLPDAHDFNQLYSAYGHSH
jgi:hypothetical protein